MTKQDNQFTLSAQNAQGATVIKTGYSIENVLHKFYREYEGKGWKITVTYGETEEKTVIKKTYR